MVTPAHWFEPTEFQARLERVQQALRAKGHDGLLVFMPESVTWLTGFFTRGYTTFQLAIVPASGAPCVVCRDVEEYYLDSTCVFPDRALWADSDDPIACAAAAIRSRLGMAPRIAAELAAWPLSAARHAALQAQLPGATWHDESRLLAEFRFIKSPAEIAYQRRAAPGLRPRPACAPPSPPPAPAAANAKWRPRSAPR